MSLPIKIVRGASRAIDVYLRDENDQPIDLTSCTEIEALVKGVTPPGTDISITLTGTEIVIVGDPKLGHAQLQWPAAKTTNMALTGYDGETVTAYSTLELKVTITGNPDFQPGTLLLDRSDEDPVPAVLGVLNIVDGF